MCFTHLLFIKYKNYTCTCTCSRTVMRYLSLSSYEKKFTMIASVPSLHQCHFNAHQCYFSSSDFQQKTLIIQSTIKHLYIICLQKNSDIKWQYSHFGPQVRFGKVRRGQMRSGQVRSCHHLIYSFTYLSTYGHTVMLSRVSSFLCICEKCIKWKVKYVEEPQLEFNPLPPTIISMLDNNINFIPHLKS